ncbi:MAG: PilN domain-containing protein [Nitrospirales bacterium]
MPIAVLDEVSSSLEPLELWLLTLSIDQPDVSIEGVALSSTDVSKFIGNLEDSSMFGQLIRMETHSRRIQGEGVQHFTLQFTTAS